MIVEKHTPSYYSIIPAPVRYDKRLTPGAKILYAEITSLTNKHGFCYSSNSYFVKLYNVSKQTINNWLKNLEKIGYIERHIYRDRGSKEILNRYITIFDNPIQINLNRPIQKILNDNTINNLIVNSNIKSNKIKNKKNNLTKGIKILK